MAVACSDSSVFHEVGCDRHEATLVASYYCFPLQGSGRSALRRATDKQKASLFGSHTAYLSVRDHGKKFKMFCWDRGVHRFNYGHHASSVQDGQWHEIVLAFNGDWAKLYVDGKRVMQHGGCTRFRKELGAMRFGYHQCEYSRISLWDRELEEREISTGKAICSEKGLVSQYLMADKKDEKGKGPDLRVSGGDFGRSRCKADSAHGLYGSIKVGGKEYHKFWWFTKGSSWPAGKTDVLADDFGDCQANDPVCFQKLPKDDVGNEFLWKFDASNSVAHAAFKAFVPLGRGREGRKGGRHGEKTEKLSGPAWTPQVLKDCHSSLSMGHAMCGTGCYPAYGNCRIKGGVDKLSDRSDTGGEGSGNHCTGPATDHGLTLYFHKAGGGSNYVAASLRGDYVASNFASGSLADYDSPGGLGRWTFKVSSTHIPGSGTEKTLQYATSKNEVRAANCFITPRSERTAFDLPAIGTSTGVIISPASREGKADDNSLALHTGHNRNKEYLMVKFKATRDVNVAGYATELGAHCGGIDVWMYKGSTLVSSRNGLNSDTPFTFPATTLAAGSTLTISVGPNGNFGCDHSSLSLTIN
ncbi:unnamed protein product [Symbiodinium natans]|uniref:Uncharacterized protein n=1 Tax=Symbiodinium natans TaxID=878477 RepID=A0A812J850_9DINO|nr:unnamed protein product [Symbiodinium natans]